MFRPALLPAALSAVLLSACSSVTPAPVAPLAAATASAVTAAKTKELANFLIGYFTSAEQAKNDKDFFNIELRIVPVWPDRADGPWMYVEQADAKTPEKPYRQRLYRLEMQGEKYVSHIYTLKGDPLRFASDWKKPIPLGSASPADIEERKGCAVIMTRNSAGNYVGATAERACSSDLRGASYASSIVDVSPTLLNSWDQGYNADGKQVWGSTKGPYMFVKVSAKP